MASSVFSRPFFFFYNLLWRAALPFLKRSRRLADGWNERLVPEHWLEPDFPAAPGEPAVDIWLQAASGGEARLAVAVCQALDREKAFRVLVVTWTRQGRDVIENAIRPLKESHPLLKLAVRFAPFDRPDIVRRALALARPRIVALLETELWPSLMAACREQDVPLYVMNGRITASTVNFGRRFSSLMKAIAPCSVHAISENDRRGFAAIFPCATQTMPNIKFDLAAELLEKPLSDDAFRAEGPVFLFASVRSGEETRLPGQFSRIFAARPEACIVVVPRHLHRVESWRSVLSDLGFAPLLVSEMGEKILLPEGRILIWDRFGDLPRLYASAQTVFVGGSFGQGGQNFLESLAAGRVPCIGPSASNFLWAMSGEGGLKTLEQSDLLHSAPTPREVIDLMVRQAESPRPRAAVRKEFQDWLSLRLGGARRTASELEKAMKSR